MNKKDNQRVRLTKRIFRESLINLLQTKPIHQITVSELCKYSELNRSTFYKYYNNVYDMLLEIKTEIMVHANECISSIDVSDTTAIIKPIYQLLCYIDDNADLYRLILHNDVGNDILGQMIDNAFELLRDNFSIIKCDIEKHREYIFSYLISGSITIIKNWLDGGQKESIKEITDLIYQIALHVLQIEF